MSDSKKKLLKRMTIMSVKADDFVRFLESKTVDDDLCPICETDKWTIICPSGEESTFRFGTQIRNVEEMFYFSTFGYFCENCGYLRQHVSSVVHKWVRDNPVIEADTVDVEGSEDSENVADE